MTFCYCLAFSAVMLMVVMQDGHLGPGFQKILGKTYDKV